MLGATVRTSFGPFRRCPFLYVCFKKKSNLASPQCSEVKVTDACADLYVYALHVYVSAQIWMSLCIF